MLDFGTWSRDEGTQAGPALTTREGLWVNQIEKWEKKGKPGDTPPGVPSPGKSVKREEDPKRRDYHPLKGSYLLRPEVRCVPLKYMRSGL
jgi:hypothetical protein